MHCCSIDPGLRSDPPQASPRHKHWPRAVVFLLAAAFYLSGLAISSGNGWRDSLSFSDLSSVLHRRNKCLGKKLPKSFEKAKYVRPSQNISPGSLEHNFLITSRGILIEVTTRIGYGWINIPAGPNMNQGNSHCFGSRCGEGNMQTWNIEPCWSFVFLLPLMYLNEYWMRSDALCSCFPKVSAHSIWFFTGVSSDFPPLLLPPVFESCQLLLKVWKMLWKPNHQPSSASQQTSYHLKKDKDLFFCTIISFFTLSTFNQTQKNLQQKPIFVFDIQASGNNEIDCIGTIAIEEDFLWTAATLSLTLWGVPQCSVFSWETVAAVEAK